MGRIMMLDCTLRDGAYVVDSQFGSAAVKGIIKKLQDAHIEIIECGWLKDAPHSVGSSFFHVPFDIKPYLLEKSPFTEYAVMIDWDRYDLRELPDNDGKTIDAVRVVFPREHFREGIALGKVIKAKGYKVFFQVANTLAYSENELLELADCVNEAMPHSLSVVDTFGAMYFEDLERIVAVLDEKLKPEISLGFHSHNNQQLSFALSMRFAELMKDSDRCAVIDSSLCGIGRGAGNATTELVASYLNRKHNGNYDLNVILDAIDMYMGDFTANYNWGYSTPFFISGLYCAHVNNIAYLLNNHRTNAMDMRNIIESLDKVDRTKYDYDLLEKKYLEYQNKSVDDREELSVLKNAMKNRPVLMVLPGKTAVTQKRSIDEYILANDPVIIGVNAWLPGFEYDFLFFSNTVRYDYAKEIYPEAFGRNKIIVTSNIKTEAGSGELVINFNLLVKRGWQHFDNAGIMCLRLLNKLDVKDISIAGFDGFEDGQSDDYADPSLPRIKPGKEWHELNDEISDMIRDFVSHTQGKVAVSFITSSMFSSEV